MSDSRLILGSMEYFLLALVGRVGLTSLYALREQAGLQPGGIRSALAHLEESGLISRAVPAKRRRRNLELTVAGEEALSKSWGQCMTDHPDAEAVLRSAVVAWLMDAPETAATYIQGMQVARGQKAHAIGLEAEHLKRSQSGPISSYSWMRLEMEAHRRQAESEALESIGLSLRERFKKDVDKKASK